MLSACSMLAGSTSTLTQQWPLPFVNHMILWGLTLIKSKSSTKVVSGHPGSNVPDTNISTCLIIPDSILIWLSMFRRSNQHFLIFRESTIRWICCSRSRLISWRLVRMYCRLSWVTLTAYLQTTTAHPRTSQVTPPADHVEQSKQPRWIVLALPMDICLINHGACAVSPIPLQGSICEDQVSDLGRGPCPLLFSCWKSGFFLPNDRTKHHHAHQFSQIILGYRPVYPNDTSLILQVMIFFSRVIDSIRWKRNIRCRWAAFTNIGAESRL